MATVTDMGSESPSPPGLPLDNHVTVHMSLNLSDPLPVSTPVNLKRSLYLSFEHTLQLVKRWTSRIQKPVFVCGFAFLVVVTLY